jgi:hypothetical protein
MGKYEEAFRERRIKLERIKKQISEWYEAQQIENYNRPNNRCKLHNKLMNFLLLEFRRKPN